MSDIKYVLEIWDSVHKKYIPTWKGDNIDWANRMYDKPYNRRHTRRVVQVTREVLFKDKGDGQSKHRI